MRTFNEIVRKGEPEQRWTDLTLHNQIIIDALVEASKNEKAVDLKSFAP